MAYSGNKGLTRIVKATQYSWQGLRAAYRHEEAFRQETWLCLVLVPLGLYLGEDGVEKALLVASALLIPIVEILNSAIEAVVDRFGSEIARVIGACQGYGFGRSGLIHWTTCHGLDTGAIFLMIAYPQIDPVVVALGPVKVHWYGLMYLLAFASALVART